MRLEEAREGDVVQNRRNKSYYRFVGPEAQRIRIRPLELSPNGLLVEKTADTIVDCDLEVDLICLWSDEVFVDIPPDVADQLRAIATQQLEQKQAELKALELASLTTEPKNRGAYAVKIRACRWRIEALLVGLKPRTKDVQAIQVQQIAEEFLPKQIIQLPSGQPGQIKEVFDGSVQLNTKVSGVLRSVEVPRSLLRPWSAHSVASV